jgi:hypothetical protein
MTLSEIAVDGTKIRASASKGSFKTGEKLLKIEAVVAERLTALKQELTDDPGASSRRRQATRERAARDVQARAGRARAALERLEAERKARAKTHSKDEAKKKEPRSMRFPDGAVRPAYNAQIAATPKEGVIVAIEVTDRRNDAGLAGPMVDDIARRYGKAPDRLLIDTSYATSEDIIALAAHAAGAVSVYTPPPRERDDVKPATLARRIRKREKEPVCLKEWRERMASEAGQAVYALRKRIERINADRKNHGFGFLPQFAVSSKRRPTRSGTPSPTISWPPDA